MSHPAEIEKTLSEIQSLLDSKDIHKTIQNIGQFCKAEETIFSTSLGLEDQALTYLLYENKVQVEIFTLDTGRLFQATYDTLQRTIQKYKLNIKSYFPNTDAVQEMLNKKGPNSFYESVENRRECCYIRKIEPLKRALKGKKFWITGLRKSQSENRSHKPAVEWDDQNKIVKIHPLFDWDYDYLFNFVREHRVPYNPLYNENFLSIGCEPCTRAVAEGEDERAGRWWWEDSKKECGLHA